MAKPRLADVLSHWHKPFTDFQTSALDFYTAVEEGLKKREIPDISVSRVSIREGGLGSTKRIYLRVKRREVAFEIGAAPFGTGYFFSWWLTRVQPSRWLGTLVFLLLIAGMPWVHRGALKILTFVPIPYSPYTNFLVWRVPLLGRTVYSVLVFIIAFLIVRAIASRFCNFDGLLSAVPIFGPVYRRAFVRDTYYSVDTALTYRAIVKSVVEEAIESATAAKGLRALTDAEKKPLMENFYKP